jgi:hypothetical protein
MATSTWFGGYGKYGAARHWNPRGVPGVGTTAVIDRGEVVVRRQDVAATVMLGGLDAGSQPTLDLRNSSVSRLTMPADLPQQPYATTQSPPEYGTVKVFGHSSIGSLDIGNFANMVRAPAPYGHGPLTALDNLTIALNGSANLDTAFDVKDGSTLTVNGAETSSFNAASSTIEGGHVVVNAPLGGNGTILMTNGDVFYYGEAQTGTLELGGSVGSGETIDIRMGHLQIDKPMAFAGQIDIRASESIPGQPESYGTQSVALENLTATAYSFDDLSHTMTLFDGATAVDQVHFTPDVMAASFGPGFSGHIGVAQTAEGVFLRGQYSGYPTGAVEIPMQTSPA